jgi:hypothetical protein
MVIRLVFLSEVPQRPVSTASLLNHLQVGSISGGSLHEMWPLKKPLLYPLLPVLKEDYFN